MGCIWASSRSDEDKTPVEEFTESQSDNDSDDGSAAARLALRKASKGNQRSNIRSLTFVEEPSACEDHLSLVKEVEETDDAWENSAAAKLAVRRASKNKVANARRMSDGTYDIEYEGRAPQAVEESGVVLTRSASKIAMGRSASKLAVPDLVRQASGGSVASGCPPRSASKQSASSVPSSCSIHSNNSANCGMVRKDRPSAKRRGTTGSGSGTGGKDSQLRAGAAEEMHPGQLDLIDEAGESRVARTSEDVQGKPCEEP